MFNLHSHVLHHYVFLLGKAQCLEVFFFGALSSTSSSVQCISRPHPSLPTHSLSGEAQFYLGMALSQNTKKSYSSGMRQFYSYCSQTGLTPTFPINEGILINFSVCMARSVQHSTTKNYLSAIKHYHSSHGYQIDLFLRLQLILRGIKRSQGDNSKTRRPITLHISNILPPLKCQIYQQQRFLNGLGSYDTCLFRFSSYWGTNLRFSLQS